ncbi:MAG: type II toxin-antitoxin system mRNA interferase toxin, RelE/StbE family [Patescibacteria group bacterium]
MIKIKRTGKFDQMLKGLVAEDEKLLSLTETKILLFAKNPTDTRVENHPLKRRLKGKWAFNITNDVRIVYEWQGKNAVRFLAVGKHEKIYKRP